MKVGHTVDINIDSWTKTKWSRCCCCYETFYNYSSLHSITRNNKLVSWTSFHNTAKPVTDVSKKSCTHSPLVNYH